MPSLEERLPLGEAGVLVAAALVALAFHFTLPGKLPDDDDYRAAFAHVETARADSDVVLVFPWWAERARVFAPEGLEVVGYLGGDADPLTAHARIWVLGQPGLPRADLAAFHEKFLPGRTAVGASQRFGPLELTLYANGRHRPLRFSAADQLARAQVYLEAPGGARTTCPSDGRGFRCGGNSGAAAEWHELRFEPRRCIFARPPGGSTRLVIEVEGVPPDATLSVEGGIIWEHAPRREPRLTPLRVGVDDAVSGATLARVDVPPGLEGMQKASGSAAPSGRVKLWVQSDNAEGREACVDLFGYGAAAVR